MPYRPTGRPRGRPAYPGLLTPAEQRVLEGVRRGLTNQEISDELGLSPNTVKTHIAAMLSKLYLGDRRELAGWRPDQELAPVGARRWYAGILAALRRLAGAVPPPLVGGSLLAVLILGTVSALAFLTFGGGGDDDQAARLVPASSTAPGSPATPGPTGPRTASATPPSAAATSSPVATSTQPGAGTPVDEQPATSTPGPQETPGPAGNAGAVRNAIAFGHAPRKAVRRAAAVRLPCMGCADGSRSGR